MNSPDFILPEGITGFFSHGSPYWTSINRFTRLCREVINNVGGEIVGFELFPYVISTNFSMAVVKIPHIIDKEVEILVNSHYPIMAFALWKEEGYGFNGPHSFIDIPLLRDQFQDEYRVLRAKDLELTFDSHNKFLTRYLALREIQRIESFEPKTLGEVIFNFWH